MRKLNEKELNVALSNIQGTIDEESASFLNDILNRVNDYNIFMKPHKTKLTDIKKGLKEITQSEDKKYDIEFLVKGDEVNFTHSMPEKIVVVIHEESVILEIDRVLKNNNLKQSYDSINLILSDDGFSISITIKDIYDVKKLKLFKEALLTFNLINCSIVQPIRYREMTPSVL